MQVLGQAGRVAEVADRRDRADLIVGGNGKRRPHLFRIEARHRMGVQSVRGCLQGEIRGGRAGVMQVNAIGSAFAVKVFLATERTSTGALLAHD